MCRGRAGSWRDHEGRAIDELVRTYGDFFQHKQSDASAARACCAFLGQLESCAKVLKADKAPRVYRDGFTANYRQLFSSSRHERAYCAELLDASRMQCPKVRVNGESFAFSARTRGLGAQLRHCLEGLAGTLRCWSLASRRPGAARPARPEVRAVLAGLDRAWAAFEDAYISELMGMHAQARRPLAEAVWLESRMRVLEEAHGEAPLHVQIYVDAQRLLCDRLAHISAVINPSRKGRGDLGPAPVNAALELLRCGGAGPLRPLALELARAYGAMREYLGRAGEDLLAVDPQLAHNAGLVERLACLEEASEAASRCILDAAMCDGMHCAITTIRAAQGMVPEFRTMCAEYDAELFLVLPRLVWLSYLSEPAHEALLKSLLPHCFSLGRATHRSAAEESSADLHSFLQQYRSTQRVLEGALWHAHMDAAPEAAWRMLLRRVVMGADLDSGSVNPALQGRCKDALEAFVRELETWSMELQRHCPREWNEWSSRLLRCLADDATDA